MSAVNAFGALSLEATQAAIRSDLDERYSGGKTAYATTVTNAGVNSLIVPTTGKALRVVWVSAIPSPTAGANRLQFKFSGGGTPFYEAYAVAHWEVFTGPVNQPLLLVTETADPVSVTVHYREV